MKSKQITNLVKLNHQLNQEREKQTTAIEKVIIGSSSFLLLTPIYLGSMSEATLPIAILSLLEVGSIYLPIKGIQTILNTRKRMILTKQEIKDQKKDTNSEEIQNAYQLVIRNIQTRGKSEKKKTKMKKMEKELHKLYKQTLL